MGVYVFGCVLAVLAVVSMCILFALMQRDGVPCSRLGETCNLYSAQGSRIDSQLDVPATVEGALVTTVHTLVRFAEYKGYPYKLWESSKAWNPVGWLDAIRIFLSADDQHLDYAFSLQKKTTALSKGTLNDAIEFMKSQEVQKEIDETIERLLANSLDVERMHQQIKGVDGRKTLGLPRRSRDGILQRYHIHREKHVVATMRAEKQLEKVKFMNTCALATQENPSMLPRPRGMYLQGHQQQRGQASSSLRQLCATQRNCPCRARSLKYGCEANEKGGGGKNHAIAGWKNTVHKPAIA